MRAAEAVKRLNATWDELSSQFDLSGSSVGARAKKGRSRPGSTLDQYISFKDASGRNAGLVIFRMGDGPIQCEVHVRLVRGKSSIEYSRQYPLDDFVAAVTDYKERLRVLGVPRRI